MCPRHLAGMTGSPCSVIVQALLTSTFGLAVPVLALWAPGCHPQPRAPDAAAPSRLCPLSVVVPTDCGFSARRKLVSDEPVDGHHLQSVPGLPDGEPAAVCAPLRPGRWPRRTEGWLGGGQAPGAGVGCWCPVVSALPSGSLLWGSGSRVTSSLPRQCCHHSPPRGHFPAPSPARGRP